MALQVLTARCQGKKSCLVRASTRDFGDPCYSGTRKYLSVIYTCGESQNNFTESFIFLPPGGDVRSLISLTCVSQLLVLKMGSFILRRIVFSRYDDNNSIYESTGIETLLTYFTWQIAMYNKGILILHKSYSVPWICFFFFKGDSHFKSYIAFIR